MSEITTKSLIKQMEEDFFIEGHQNDAFDGEQFDIVLHALKLQELLKKEFIDCDEYPPLTTWYKENIEKFKK